MRALAVCLAGSFIAACASSPDVTTDSDPSANFAGYRTYTWVTESVPRGMNPLLYQRVQNTIDQHLTSRSYMLSDEDPDFAIGMTLGSRDRVEADDFGVYGSYYPGYHGAGLGPGWNWGAMYTPTEIRTVTDGTLAVDIYDADTKKPVWHGHASEEVRTDSIEQEQIDRVVTALMSRFPPVPDE